ncbi:MAG: adenylate/guanylate cyclase domain-containing protein [Nitrososphaerales archaeon]|jgi:class 3 adenylate cyclase/predicted transcriptional regulator
MSDRPIKRSKTDIYASILEVVLRNPGGGRITRVSYGVGVPLDRLRVMMDDLIIFGLLKKTTADGETTYSATPRGLEFLETYWKMNGYLETFEETPSRGLAAIMFTDVVGYTALAQRNEKHALGLLEEYRAVTREALPKFHGREVKTIGDAFMVEFTSALEASQCAIDMQRRMHERNQKVSQADRLWARIGIHVGDVERKGNDILGDAVNIGSRVYAFAEPGGICITRQVFDQVWNKLGNHLNEIGMREAKNLESPIEVFSIDLPWNADLQAKGH